MRDGGGSSGSTCAVWNWLLSSTVQVVWAVQVTSEGLRLPVWGPWPGMWLSFLIPVASLSAWPCLREHVLYTSRPREGGCFLNLGEWPLLESGTKMAFSQLPQCHQLEEVSVLCPISFSCSDTGALAGVDGVGTFAALTPESPLLCVVGLIQLRLSLLDPCSPQPRDA